MESRTPKGRGKRRGAASTPVNDTRTLRKGRRGSCAQTFTAPPSPLKLEPGVGLKRKGRPIDIDLSAAEQRSSKRSRPGSQAPTPDTPPTDAQGFIECPEPNCNKKYRNANGLKYHQSHSHSGNNGNTSLSVEDSKDDMDCEDIPLSVVKNSVKKEKESKKESHQSKKDKDSDKKQEKSADNGKKVNKDDSNDSKDPKCDNNSSASKKKDKDLANSNKPAAQSSNSANGGKPQTSVSKSNGTSSNSHTAGSSHGNSSSVQQPLPSQASSSTTSSSSSSLVSTSSPSSLTVSSSSVMQSTTQGENSRAEASSKLVDIKPKITSENTQRVSKPNRPIVPAPSHTVLSNVQVTHSNLSPVMTHAQMSPQLKPIQPKPTIMGEPQNINPALADLNKDRKKVQKKKSKESTLNGNTGNQPRPDQPTIKVERSGVIKTNPMPTSKTPADQQKSVMSKDNNRSDTQRSHLAPLGAKGPENLHHSRPTQNPNLLKVGSPLQVNTPDKGPASDDVQSPAYSDISDANESASPAAPSDTSPQKQKEEKKKEKSEAPPQGSGDNQSVPNYGMYYYNQQPYGMNSMSSPGQKGQGQANPGPNNSNNPAMKSAQDNRGTPTQNKDKPMGPEEPIKIKKEHDGDRDGNRPTKGNPGIPLHMQGPPPSTMSPQEYQMMYHQQMYLQSLPQHLQYQYMANGGWYQQQQPMEPSYMRQMMEEQRNREGAQGQGPPKGHPEHDMHRGPDMKGPPMGLMGSRKDDGAPKSVISPGQQSTGSNDNMRKLDDKGMKDQALRDKQNENHQILKENIELKNEMDKSKFFRQAEEVRRQRMYQEQKKMEMARKGDPRPDNLTKAPGTKPIHEHSARNLSGQHPASDMSKDNLAKRGDNPNSDNKTKDSRDSHSRDSSVSKYSDSSRPMDDNKSKSSGSEKHRAETPTRNPDTPKPRPGGSSSKSGSPCPLNSSVPIANSPSYTPYLPNYPPGPYNMQNQHFIGVEPSHPMYRNPSVNPALISSYPTNPYIHPSQMGYRPGSESDDKEKIIKPSPPTSESDPKKVDNSAPYYGNMHKIHELSEKGRPKSRNSSPVLGKSTDSNNTSFDKHRDFTNSPPTQRHVHTHHHTHVLGPGLQPGAPLQGPPAFYPVNDHYSGEYRRM